MQPLFSYKLGGHYLHHLKFGARSHDCNLQVLAAALHNLQQGLTGRYFNFFFITHLSIEASVSLVK